MLSASVFRGLLVVIVIMIEGSEKIICHLYEFRTTELACYSKESCYAK